MRCWGRGEGAGPGLTTLGFVSVFHNNRLLAFLLDGPMNCADVAQILIAIEQNASGVDVLKAG